MLLTKTVFKDCTSYLIEKDYEITSFKTGVNRMNIFLNKNNGKVLKLQIKDDEVVFNSKNTITCLRDLIEIITNNYEAQHKRYPSLNSIINKMNSKVNEKDIELWDVLVNEIDLALIEAKFKK